VKNCPAEHVCEANAAREQLENARRDLAENLRVVFVLRELEGSSTGETARAGHFRTI